jgi:hypothetical protein
MRCEHCSYPIFPYMLCCPSCSVAVERPQEAQDMTLRQMRIGFWLRRWHHVVSALTASLTAPFLSQHQR